MKKEKTKVALYCRVSTSDQTNKNQLLELRDYCERNNYEIYKEYADNGISGSKTTRPALDLMLQEMRNKKFKVVIVSKFDRLGRSTIHLLQVLEEMKNRRVRLIATSQGIDTSTPEGKFFYTILSGVAELEREMIRSRVISGLTRAKQEGKPIGKRGKDKKQRTKSGYYLRWQKAKSGTVI